MNKLIREIYKFEYNSRPSIIKKLSSSFETFEDLLKDDTSFIHDFKINGLIPESYSINTKGKDLVWSTYSSTKIHLMGHHRDRLRTTNHSIYIGTLDEDIPELKRWDKEEWVGICRKDPQYEYINCPANDENLMNILKRFENKINDMQKEIRQIENTLNIPH